MKKTGTSQGGQVFSWKKVNQLRRKFSTTRESSKKKTPFLRKLFVSRPGAWPAFAGTDAVRCGGSFGRSAATLWMSDRRFWRWLQGGAGRTWLERNRLWWHPKNPLHLLFVGWVTQKMFQQEIDPYEYLEYLECLNIICPLFFFENKKEGETWVCVKKFTPLM